MQSAVDNCIELASALGLRPGSDGQFVGRVRGFPVGLKFIDPAGAALVLVEVRHWLKADATELQSLSYEPDVAKLVAEKKIEIEFDDRSAWLTIMDLRSCLEVGPVSQLMDSVLKTFEQHGLIGDPDLCHYCRKEKVESVTSVQGKVIQICPACLKDRTRGCEVANPAAEAVPIFLLSPFAAFAGAALWAGFWIGQTLFFESQHSGTIYVPTMLVVIVVIVVGVLVGGPVGWIIRLNRRRGQTVSTAAAIVFSSLAVIVGEIFCLVWIIYRQFRVVSFPVALRVMPQYYLNSDAMYLINKLLAALFSVFFAVLLATPKPARVKL